MSGPDPTASTADPAASTADPAAPRPLELGRLLIGLGAVALLVSTFLDWYGEPESGLAFSAWSSFELVDLLLAALALGALYAVVTGVVSPARAPRAPVALPALAGPLALLLVLVAIIDPPPLFAAADESLEVGVWIALAAAVVMTIGATLGRVRISIVVGARERGRPVDPHAETRTMATDPGAEPPR